jgi:hypothetical protein
MDAQVRRSIAIGALLAAWLSIAGVPAGGARAAGRIATSSHILEARSKDGRAVKPAVSIPKGWKSYIYRGVKVSVPKSWVVQHNSNCPNTSAPGTLLLGIPKVLETCDIQPASASYVIVSDSVGTSPSTGQQRPIKVNDLAVDVGFGSPEQLEWTIPSFGLRVSTSGSHGERILHTLRRA